MIKTALASILLAGALTYAAADAAKQPMDKFYGKITSIDTTHKSVSVHNKSRKADATFAWTDNTQFMSKKQPISAGQLKAGDFLVISYQDTNGMKEARKIVLRSNFGPKNAKE
jgi:hypothetical protein